VENTLDGYIRVSKIGGREGATFISPELQRQDIERWAEYEGATIAAWHTDLDESGGTQDRPGLRAAMRRIEDGETGGLACARLDRFARNIAGAHGDLQTIKRTGARLVCVAEKIDTASSNPYADFTFTVLLAVATLQRDALAAGWETATANAVERNAYIGAAPIGYERTGRAQPLRPHPTYGPVITRCYELAASAGPHAALDYLRSQKLPVQDRKGAAAGERFWTVAKLRELLARRVYLGESYFGDAMKRDAHEALVTLAVWRAAQVPDDLGVRRRDRARYPLSGVASCAGCGSAMIGNTVRGQRTYRCRASLSNWRGERCPASASINADALEQLVTTKTRAFLLDVEGDASADDRLRQVQAAFEQSQDKLDRAIAALGEAGAADELSAIALVRDLREDRDARAAELGRVEASAGSFRHVNTDTEWDDLPLEEQRTLIRSACRRVSVARGRGLDRVTVELATRGTV
jgi:DNA invertase Pin-like site-specific DNA recombinase